MQDFKQLSVWRKAHQLVLHVYTASSALPASESLGLAANLRRSAIAVPRLIAQAAGHDLKQDFLIELRKSSAACHELEYILLLCRDLGFFAETLHDELLNELVEVRKMLSGLLSKVSAPAETVR